MKKFFSRYFIPSRTNDFQPHVLRKQGLTLFITLFLAIEIVVFMQLFVVFKITDFLAAVLPGALVNLTNEERNNLNVSSLTESPLLVQAAKLKAQDMAAKGYFAHTSPEGIEPWYWLRQVGYKYIFAGENLAVNFSESEDVSNAWMNSESHRKNIVNDKYTEIGIATAEGMYKGKKTMFVVQYFGRPATVVPPTEKTMLVEQKPNTVPAKTPVSNKTVPTQSQSQPVVVVPNNSAQSPQVIDIVTEPQVEGDTSVWKETLTKVTSSPRMYANYGIGVLVGLLLVLLLLAVVIKRHVQHPRMIAASLAVAILGIGLITFNNAVLTGNVELPAQHETASTFMAF